MHVLVHHRGEEDEAVVDAGQCLGQVDHARQGARRLDDGRAGAAAEGILALEFDGEVEALVEHAREGVRRIEADRRQHRHHLAEEVVANPGALFLGPQIAAQEDDAFLLQRRQDGLVEQFVLLGHQFVGLDLDAGKGFLRGHAVGGRAVAAHLDLFLEAGDADLEEFVEVAGDDAEEAQSLEQRHARVGDLGQDAAVEGEQRKFAVDEVVGGETAGIGVHGANLMTNLLRRHFGRCRHGRPVTGC